MALGTLVRLYHQRTWWHRKSDGKHRASE